MTTRTQKMTLLGYAILGQLIDEPLTGYRIRKRFETTPLGHYSSSPGSIYPAIKKLDSMGLVAECSPDKGTSGKYALTTAGKDQLWEWFFSPADDLSHPKASEALILRFAYMGNQVSKKDVLKFLSEWHRNLKNHLKSILIYQNATSQSKDLIQLLSVERGLMGYRTELRWLEKATKQLSQH